MLGLPEDLLGYEEELVRWRRDRNAERLKEYKRRHQEAQQEGKEEYQEEQASHQSKL